MTKDEVIAKWNGMAPRERDAWIAEDVMGWRVKEVNSDQCTVDKGAEIDYFEPTSEIDDAMDVAERFFTYRIAKEATSHGYDAIVWGEYSLSGQAGAGTLPEAIGLAALLAKLCPE